MLGFNLRSLPVFLSFLLTLLSLMFHFLSFPSLSPPSFRKWVRSLKSSVCRWRSRETGSSSNWTTWKRSSQPNSTWPIRRWESFSRLCFSCTSSPVSWLSLFLVIASGVPPSGTGEGGGAKPGLSTDADHLPEGDSGETQDRAGCN